jgi:hypothetical protein
MTDGAGPLRVRDENEILVAPPPLLNSDPESRPAAIRRLVGTFDPAARDPDHYRAGLKKQLLEMADTVPLAPMSPMREKKVRAFVRETVDTLTTNNLPN